MNNIAVILLTLVGLVIGATVTWLAARSNLSAMAQRKAELEQELLSTKSQLGQLQSENTALNAAKAAAEATLESERNNTKEKLELLSAASEEMKAQFKALASMALESNNASFLQLAKSELEKQQSEAESELEKRTTAVETLVKPIAESLKNVDEHVRALESSRAEAYGGLKAMVESLQESQSALKAETGNLLKALREPQARGRWGEMQLRRALEFAGMLQYCDFDEQVSVFAVDVAGDRHALRPDVIIRLPGGKRIVIDAKVPLTEYLKALEAPDEKLRESHLIGHARQVREHVNALAAKAYWSQFEPTPEFVILFIPGEVFFRAAFMAEPELLEAGGSKVMLASPITLVAMLRTIAYAWNQENLAEGARKISEAGRQLYDRLCVMAAHVDSLGKKLEGAVKSYNDMLSSMEKRVFPAGRRLSELDRSLPTGNLVDPQQVERTPRALESPDWQLQSETDPLLLAGEDADYKER
jgi:DNA recombination protein RmuC